MFDPAQLQTLAAVLRTGSFEAASRALGVTQSAVSQRIRALEEAAGTILVLRAQPALPTPAGARLARHAAALELIEAGVRADLGLADAATPTVRIAVNADSLATWFLPALAEANGLFFDLVIDDESHSQDLLKSGQVMAAVTSDARTVQGCDSHALGAMRFVATASPAFSATWFAEGTDAAALSRAPSLTFNAKDAMQDRWVLMTTGRDVTRPGHVIPSAQGFAQAAVLGLGWAMIPELLAREHLATGRLRALSPALPLDVPLFWQVSRLTAAPLAGLTRAVRQAARAALVGTA